MAVINQKNTNIDQTTYMQHKQINQSLLPIKNKSSGLQSLHPPLLRLTTHPIPTLLLLLFKTNSNLMK